MLSEMSINDLRQLGPSLGFSESLDNHQSIVYYPSGAAENLNHILLDLVII